MMGETRRWFAGVDWGSGKHQVCLLDAAGTVVGERAFAHGGAGLVALCDWLVSVAGHPGDVAVASEGAAGAGGGGLLGRGFARRAGRPQRAERLRGRFRMGGAKGGPRDGWGGGARLRR